MMHAAQGGVRSHVLEMIVRARSASALSLALALSGVLALSACATPAEREARRQARIQAFEQSVRDQFVGKPVDHLVLTLGPPSSTFTLSDGREVLQYDQGRTVTEGGESYTTFETYVRQRVVRDANGVQRVVEDRETVPVTSRSPVRTYHLRCVRRFVADKAKIVESFRWEGNACF
jgi:hypothetical protein